MNVTLIEQMAAGDAPPWMPLTVGQYHEMIRAGILPQGAPIELIDGLLVRKDRSAPGADPMSHDPRHALTISRLQRLDRRFEAFGYFLRVQLPVTLSDTSEPEPDVAVVKGSPEDYSNRHPGPADLPAVMEVAESSLKYDRTTKETKYATALIPQYWIVNLLDNQIEVYEEPLAEGHYARRTNYQSGQSIRLALGATQSIEIIASEVLPS